MAAQFKRLYGISKEERDAMKESQRGVCAVCEIRPAAHLDHCHVSKRVREFSALTATQFLNVTRFGRNPSEINPIFTEYRP
jgi:hypothetical protein